MRRPGGRRRCQGLQLRFILRKRPFNHVTQAACGGLLRTLQHRHHGEPILVAGLPRETGGGIGGIVPRCFIEGQTGFLVPAGAAGPLCGAIERMIDAGAEKRADMGRKGQERVRALYSKTALQSATLAVYQRVLSEAESRKASKASARPVL